MALALQRGPKIVTGGRTQSNIDRHSILGGNAFMGAIVGDVTSNPAGCVADDEHFTLVDVAVQWTGFASVPTEFTAVLLFDLPAGAALFGTVREIERSDGVHDIDCGSFPFLGSLIVTFDIDRNEVEEEYDYATAIAMLQEGHDFHDFDGLRTINLLPDRACQTCDDDAP